MNEAYKLVLTVNRVRLSLALNLSKFDTQRFALYLGVKSETDKPNSEGLT